MSSDDLRTASKDVGTVGTARTLRRRAAELVDGAAERRVLVFGSLPPDGRDLDVLARDEEHEAIARALAAAGFRRSGSVWTRFEACAATVVELRRASSWRLPADELTRLFDEATPLPAHRRMARPAPHHRLLVMAPRAAADGDVDARRRARIDEAVRSDPRAWTRARRVAAAWGSARSLRVLATLYARQPVRRGVRAAAVAETMVAEGMPRLEARLRAWRVVVRPHGGRRGAIVALSGVDGSGKSSQADALCTTLEALGHPAVVEWARIAYDPTLEAIAAPVKVFVGRLARRSPAGQLTAPSHAGSTSIVAEAGRVDRRNVSVEALWALVTALVDVRARRLLVRDHLRRGHIVVCDRYLLDTAVHLHERFAGTPLWIASHVSRMLSPRPLLAWWLRVPGETAYTRKPQEFDVARLGRHTALYERLHRPLGVVAIDGTVPRRQLCAEIAARTWLTLESR